MSADLAQVVLVDEDDRPIGVAGKLAAHQPPGQLHRALSGFVFNGRGEIILQQRSAAKHHFAGRWSNSFCTHPRPDETPTVAGERRMVEELGIGCSLRAIGSFTYRAVDPVSELVEHEVDHVLVGTCDDEPHPDPAEVAATWAVGPAALEVDLRSNPDRYTPWLAPALAVLAQHEGELRARAPEGPR